MKQFNLEEYLAHPERKVVTRMGCAVEIISTNGRKQFPIVGYINDNQSPFSWRSNGHYLEDDKTTSHDLFFDDEENEDEKIRKLLVWQVYRNIEDETNDLARSVYNGIKGHDPDLEESIEDWKKCLAYLEKHKTSEEAIRYVKENHSPDEVSDFQAAMNIAVAKAYDKGVQDTLKKQKELKPSAEEVLIRAGLKSFKDGNQWCILVGDNIQEGVCGFGDTIEDALYEFLKNVCKQNKPAEWSEEDEEMKESIIDFLESKQVYAHSRTNMIVWLKSLRPQPQRRDTYYDIIHDILATLKDMDFTQITPEHRVSLLNDIRVKCKNADECAEILDEPHWKPSKEQMKALNAVNCYGGISYVGQQNELISLYNDLKKLI